MKNLNVMSQTKKIACLDIISVSKSASDFFNENCA